MLTWQAGDAAAILLAQAEGHAAAARPAVPPGHGEAPQAEGGPGEPSQWVFFGFSLTACILLVLVAIAGTRRMRLIPRGLQNALEFIVESIYSLPMMVMGPRGEQYAPFIATFFLAIMAMNLSELIPIFKPGTASLSITLGLAIVAFLGVQYFGFRAHGIGYVKHFLGPIPIAGVGTLLIGLLLLPLELIAQLIRPMSLSIRLFGNISGEERVFAALASRFSPLASVIMLPLQVLVGILQALVFSLLVTVYIALATEKHEEGHGESAAASAR